VEGRNATDTGRDSRQPTFLPWANGLEWAKLTKTSTLLWMKDCWEERRKLRAAVSQNSLPFIVTAQPYRYQLGEVSAERLRKTVLTLRRKHPGRPNLTALKSMHSDFSVVVTISPRA